MKAIRLITIFLVLVLGCVMSGRAQRVHATGTKQAAASESSAMGTTVTLTPLGTPIWKPVDIHLFSAPVGTRQSGYREFMETVTAIWGPPDHPIPTGQPHDPPYDTELAEGIAAQGYHEGHRFSPDEFSNGQGVFVAFMLLPDPGTTGSSPDYASGPIIPNRLFPLVVDGTLRREGRLFDPDLDSTAPPVNSIPRFEDIDGFSHLPFIFASNMDFAPIGVMAEGAYEYQFRMTDRDGEGWVARIAFTVGVAEERVLLPLVVNE
jgi:hypothetical protein